MKWSTTDGYRRHAQTRRNIIIFNTEIYSKTSLFESARELNVIYQ